MKGIILAGGKATRLFPITKVVSKQLLPIYDKPMIYYPLSVLMLAGIRDILVISTPQDISNFRHLFEDGTALGLSIAYAAQPEPKGIAQAFLIGEKFIGQDSVSLILGDNLFFGDKLTVLLKEAASQKEGATVFAYNVKDSGRYGVVSFNDQFKATSIVEKPKNSKSPWAVTGLYFYDQNVVRYAKKLKPSARGELEITDINKIYLQRGRLNVQLLGRGFAWLDTGTYDSLIDASMFIKTIEDRQGLKIGCIEEVAYRMGFINAAQLEKIASSINTRYGEYLTQIVRNEK